MFNYKKIKELETKNKTLENTIKRFENDNNNLSKVIEEKNTTINKLTNEYTKFRNNVNTRDYLIQTNFVGKLKNERVINQFKRRKLITEDSKITSFAKIKKEIEDFYFINLDMFMQKLNHFENVENILNAVKKQENAKTKKSTKNKLEKKQVCKDEGKVQVGTSETVADKPTTTTTLVTAEKKEDEVKTETKKTKIKKSTKTNTKKEKTTTTVNVPVLEVKNEGEKNFEEASEILFGDSKIEEIKDVKNTNKSTKKSAGEI